MIASSSTVSPICMPDTSCSIQSGMSFGSASIVTSRVICSSTPPSLAPGASSAPVSSSATVASIGRSRRTRNRSMWTVSPVTGWLGELLDHDGGLAAAVDREVEHRSGPRQRLAQHARVDLERERILTAAVDDAGNLALATQAAGAAGSAGLARADVERCGLGC